MNYLYRDENGKIRTTPFVSKAASGVEGLLALGAEAEDEVPEEVMA